MRKTDITALGDTAPEAAVLAAHMPDVGVEESLIATGPEVYITTPYFDEYLIILVWLDRIPVPELERVLVEAWLDRAPKQLPEEYLRRMR
ncbi:hypothetical protein NOGI109294_14565 [Nocardiopsis gilva]|uniref:hypothetical protein n=1 Tax=Nocardiopsis gilva TaxID=280236 RepID=UPI0003694471|nr:hypothetical protein [Nocardiopsis gilva]